MNILRVTLNNHPVLRASVTLNRGAEPSTMDCIVAADSLESPYVLTVQDESGNRKFRQFTQARVFKNADGTIELKCSDARTRWNKLIASVVGQTGVALKVAIQALLQAAGEQIVVKGEVGNRISTKELPSTLLAAINECVRRAGLSFTISDREELEIHSTGSVVDLPESRLISQSGMCPESVVLVGAGALNIIKFYEWQAVIPDDSGELIVLLDHLAEQGISENKAREAALSEGGFEKLLGSTGTNIALRLAKLKRFAFRLFRPVGVTGEWVPVGGVSAVGLLPPRIEADFDQPKGLAPKHPTDSGFESGGFVQGAEIDCKRGTVFFRHPPYASKPDGATWQERRLIGDPAFALSIAVPNSMKPQRWLLTGQDTKSAEVIFDPTLQPVYEDGKLLNASEVSPTIAHWRKLANDGIGRLSRVAGLTEHQAAGRVSSVILRADKGGLVTDIFERLDLSSLTGIAKMSRQEDVRLEPPVPDHQPINAYRAGPIILKARGSAPEGESVVAVEATSCDPKTSALELDNLGPLAFPYFLPSIDTSRYGRWLFVAGCEATADGKVRILDDDSRHEDIDAPDMQPVRKARPKGLRGLLVVEEKQPAFFEGNPLIADAHDKYSTEVAGVDGDRVSEKHRGGLQFLTNVVLSPAHNREAAGGGDTGWVPALNFADGATGAFSAGRGLFAEGDGHDLGRLTAHDQGGPILADGSRCSKHSYGVAADGSGVYRENAGHISTDAFFKIPGDTVHDAPLKFYPEPFAGRVPPWRPFEARILYDAHEHHSWNKTKRDGKWRIQYRLPFYPRIPPTWRPPIRPPYRPPEEPPVEPPDDWEPPRTVRIPEDAIEPVLTDNEMWAPSFDWVPAQSDRSQNREVAYPGPSLSSAGYAREIDGVPESSSGGCLFLPPTRTLADSGQDAGTRDHHVVLHPEVCLNFGHPIFSGDNAGGVSDGWEIKLVDGVLAITPLDDAGNTADAGTVRIDGDLHATGKLTVDGIIDPTGLELDPQSTNPGHAANTIWLDDSNSHLMRGGVDIEQLIEDLRARIEALENGGA
ncbi:MAG: hypothetical protein V3V10_01055 [Planctomycetota bacterium]